MSDKPVVILDIDDVLQAFNHPHFTKQVERELGVSFPYEAHLDPYLMATFPHVTKERELEIVHMVYDDPEFWNANPMEGAKEAVEFLSTHFTLVPVTARPAITSDWTLAYHARHFPGQLDPPIFIGLTGSAENISTKLQHAVTRGAIAMVDDTRHNLDGCAEANIAGILRDHPWNCKHADHPDFTRVSTWEEITATLLSLVSAAA